MNLFEIASKRKIRFKTGKGYLSTEDLWSLSKKSLDLIYNTVINDMEKDNKGLIPVTEDVKFINNTKLKIIIYLFNYKKSNDVKIIQKPDNTEEIL